MHDLTDSVSARSLYLVGALQAPLTGELRHKVHALLRHGRRTIVLDMAGVPSIDAAGVGELVWAYNITRAAHGVLQVVNATAWVREILERVALFHVLSAGRT
jgi:anti-anti-sigma factor